MSFYGGVMALQIAVYIATQALKTSDERSAKDRQTAFSNSYGDAVAISGRFIPLLSRSTWLCVSVCPFAQNVSHVCTEGRESWRPVAVLASEWFTLCVGQAPLILHNLSLWRLISEALLQTSLPRLYNFRDMCGESEDNCNFELTTSKE